MRLLLAGALGILGSIGESTSAWADIEVDLDSDGAGGDGVSGQVIGVVTAPGVSIVNAVNNTAYSSTSGGDADATAIVSLVNNNTPRAAEHQAADSATGDGVSRRVIGASADMTGDSHVGTEDSVQFIAFDLGP